MNLTNSRKADVQLDRWRSAVNRGKCWLMQQLTLTPTFNQANADLNWFAKVPWSLVASNERAGAIRSLRLFETAVEHSQLHHPTNSDWTNSPAYGLGWLVVGARLSEQYVLARSLYSELGRYACPEYGAIFSGLDRTNNRDQWFDMAIQGAILHASVSMGDLKLAEKVGELVSEWFKQQPDIESCILNLYHPERGYLREVPRDRIRQVQFSSHDSRQPWANIGFAIQGLIRVGEATGNFSHIDTAYQIVSHLADHYSEDLVSYSQNHKVAHAACMLGRKFRDDRLLNLSISIADRIANNITVDGRAYADIVFDRIGDQPLYVSVRTTCDSILWLQAICDELEFDGAGAKVPTLVHE